MKRSPPRLPEADDDSVDEFVSDLDPASEQELQMGEVRAAYA